jgi:DnaJ-class molecular chaperone
MSRTRPCPECDGYGTVEVTPMAGQMHDDIAPCERCNTTGRIERQPRKPRGGSVQ